MPLSIVIHHYLVSTDLNKQSGVVNYTNLGGISCLPGIIIHYHLFKNFLMTPVLWSVGLLGPVMLPCHMPSTDFGDLFIVPL